MNTTLNAIAIGVAVLVCAPVLSYMLIKFGATAYFNAKRRHERRDSRPNREEGKKNNNE